MLRLYEFYQDEQYVYLVTEHCGGGDLLQRLRQSGCMPETQVARIMKQVLAAVEYCHKLKVVHRYGPFDL